MKVRIEKVINNNIIQARDHNGVELVVMGRVLFQAAQDDDRQLLSSRLFVGEGG